MMVRSCHTNLNWSNNSHMAARYISFSQELVVSDSEMGKKPGRQNCQLCWANSLVETFGITRFICGGYWPYHASMLIDREQGEIVIKRGHLHTI